MLVLPFMVSAERRQFGLLSSFHTSALESNVKTEPDDEPVENMIS